MKTLGELCLVAEDGVLTTDRDGEFGCGPVFWTHGQIVHHGLHHESITLVAENEDPDAWELMREAIDMTPGGDQSALSLVAVGIVPKHPNDAQVIYGVSLRGEVRLRSSVS